MMKKFFRIFSFIFLAVLALGFFVRQAQKDYLKVCFFDIGQGDAILIRTPQGHNILIDGGPDNSILAKLGQALPFYDRTIDLMVLSHPQADHITGQLGVLKKFDVKNVLASKVNYSSQIYDSWKQLVKNENADFIEAVAGQDFIFDQARLKVLSPFFSLQGKAGDDINNQSVSLKLNYFSTSFLFTGDMETKGEAELVAKWGANLEADILKAGHHGSDTSSSKKFLEIVRPKIAVIQVAGDNDYGMPSLRVLDRFKKTGVQVFRNDLESDVCFGADEENYWH